MTVNEKIIILDFGSQYTQLIARKVRETGVYAEIHPFNIENNILDTLFLFCSSINFSRWVGSKG